MVNQELVRVMKRALITGITGQDGQHLALFLHEMGYEVFGLVRGQHNQKLAKLLNEMPFIRVCEGDLGDLSSLVNAVKESQPDEVYNLAAMSFVAHSFGQATSTVDTNGVGVLRLLEAIRLVDGDKNNIRFYQASTSEMFGKVREIPQTETTPFYPRSPYACAKAMGHNLTINYRESYGMHASCGILFNHEGPRRGLEFVTRKITNAVARIALGKQELVVLGNLDAKRDWGFAGDYVKAMWLMLQKSEPEDYVIATGITNSVYDFLNLAFTEVGINDWEHYVRLDPKYLRPAEVEILIGDPSKAKEKLGWEPEVDFKGLVSMMVQNDLKIEDE